MSYNRFLGIRSKQTDAKVANLPVLSPLPNPTFIGIPI